MHDFRNAFRNTPELSSRIAAIDEGSGHADMIQDLNDLSLLGKANTELLTAIGFDLTRLDTCAATAEEIAALFSRVSVARTENDRERVIRDKAYIFIKQALDEVRSVCFLARRFTAQGLY